MSGTESTEPVASQAAPAAVVSPTAGPAIVVRGDATPEQLAALVAVLSAASGDDEPASEERTSSWASHPATMRHPVSRGPGAWRTSLRA